MDPKPLVASLLLAHAGVFPGLARAQFDDDAVGASLRGIKAGAAELRRAAPVREMMLPELGMSLRERVTRGQLQFILRMGPGSGDPVANILAAGGEKEYFDSAIRPTLAPLPPELSAVLRDLRAHVPTLDPQTFFSRTGAMGLVEGDSGGYVLPLVDGRGVEHKPAFIAFLHVARGGKDNLLRETAILLHEHAHQRQLSTYALSRRLKEATGMPGDPMAWTQNRLFEGHAQRFARTEISRIIRGGSGPLAPKLRRSLREEISDGLPFYKDSQTAKELARVLDVQQGLVDLSDKEIEFALDELLIRQDQYKDNVALLGALPALPGSGDAAHALVVGGDVSALTRTWSPARRDAIALLAQQARTEEALGKDALTRETRLELVREVAAALGPGGRYGPDEAREFLRRRVSVAPR